MSDSNHDIDQMHIEIGSKAKVGLNVLELSLSNTFLQCVYA